MRGIRVSLNRIAIVVLLAILLACNLASAYSSTNQVDVVIAFDTTGSMGGYINSMKDNAKEFASSLAKSGMDYRLGLTEFKDFPISCGSYCGDSGDFAYNIYNSGRLVDNPTEFNAFITALSASGGADIPESHLAALKHTVNDQSWRGDAVQKVIILISDAPPHADGNCCNVEGDTFSSIKNILASNLVTLYIVGRDIGGGGVPNGWATDLATSTGGKYYPLGDLKPILEDITNKMDAIKISPKDPTTLKSVTLKADVKLSGDNEITGYSWKVGGVSTSTIEWEGNGKSWSFTPAAGKYGSKNAMLITHFKNKVTGKTGFDVRSKSFKVFFKKDADDDNAKDSNGNKIPNWFTYWKKDGAIPEMSNVEYDGDLGGYGESRNSQVYISPDAAGVHYSTPIKVTTGSGIETFGGPTVKGIDCAAEVVAHENFHKKVQEGELEGNTGDDLDKWQKGPSKICAETDPFKWLWCKLFGKGIQFNTNDPCPDGLNSDYESAISHTDPNKPDTWNLEKAKSEVYAIYGDQELEAMRAAIGKRGDSTKDWANPGKQTTTVYSPYVYALRPLNVTPKAYLVQSGINGSYIDSAVDNNGNGLFDNLNIAFDVEVATSGRYGLVGLLNDSSGKRIELVNKRFELQAGINRVELAFDGLEINRHGVNGPYNFSIGLFEEDGWVLDFKENAHQTAIYNYMDFEGQQASFSGSFSDAAEDSNGDGVFDNLMIDVGVDVKKSGTFLIEGFLYAEGDNPLSFATTNATLAEGLNEVKLTFSGSSIAFGEWDGQYRLRYLSLYDEFGTRLGFELDPYQTKAYNAKSFKSTDASLTDITDAGQDTNGDGLFENLKITVGVDVSKAGNYLIEGNLRDSLGNEIEMNFTQMYLDAGARTVPLIFSGKTIYAHGVDGPFNLTNLLLYNESGIIKDSKKYAHTTSYYNCADFKPLIVLTGDYSDSGEDANLNGLFENLIIDVGVEVAKSGNVVAKARLLDPSANEICLANGTALIEAGGPKFIQLKFRGSEIYKHGVNGPYLLSDLQVYHAIDTTPVLADEVYTTSVYRYQDFEQNRPPNAPSKPSGTASGYAWAPYSYQTSATDPDGDQVQLTIDWGDGTTSTTELVDSATSASLTHTWTAAGTYQIKAMSTDSKGATSAWSASLAVTIAPNKKPNAPSKLIGPTSGYVGASYPFLTAATDPNGDKVKYTYDWGDGTTYTTPLVNSGITASISHKWTVAGTYRVRTMATDSKGAPSAWSKILTVKIANRYGAADEISAADEINATNEIGAENELDPISSTEEKIQKARERIDEARSAIQSVRDRGDNL